MNAKRIKRLRAIVNEIQAVADKLNDVSMDEQEAYDNMPESLQESDKGYQIQENADELSNFYDAIMDIADEIDNFVNALA